MHNEASINTVAWGVPKETSINTDASPVMHNEASKNTDAYGADPSHAQ